jgi:hypothetical protein
MTLAQIQHALGLGCLTPGLDLGREVSSAHASDLLSDALANAPAGGVLLTIQVHLNVVAVALHAQQAAVIFTWGMQPDETVVRRAVEEGLPLFAAAASTFEVAGELYVLGVRGAPAAGRPLGAAVSGEAGHGSAEGAPSAQEKA